MLNAAGALALLALIVALAPRPAAAQSDDLAELCSGSFGGDVECRLAEAAVRMIQPRVGIGLWGGSPVPGSASTLGMRLGSLPRFSTAGRITVLPMELPPLPDRSQTSGSRGTAAALSGQATVGLLGGWSPLPTVGGVMSLDATARASWLLLPGEHGFDNSSVLGASVGLRLGLLRESLTLPGISLTAAYGRSTGVSYGDPDGSTDGYIDGSVGNWKGTAALTQRFGPARVTGGASYDRYTSDVDLSYPGAPAALGADASTDRWSAFGNVSWTLLIFHAALEAGWQESPTPEGIPSDVTLDPTGWWISAAFRVSI